jgi:hypothetical protein
LTCRPLLALNQNALSAIYKAFIALLISYSVKVPIARLLVDNSALYNEIGNNTNIRRHWYTTGHYNIKHGIRLKSRVPGIKCTLNLSLPCGCNCVPRETAFGKTFVKTTAIQKTAITAE